MVSIKIRLVSFLALVAALSGPAHAGGIFSDGFESGDVSAWTLAVGFCGDDLANGGEECDGADLAGLTCAALGYGAGNPACSSCCKVATITCAGNHAIAYESLSQSQHTGDLTRVRWHSSGRFALILTDTDAVLRYDAATGAVTVSANLGPTASTADLDVARSGGFFLIVGTLGGVGQVWSVDVAPGDVITFSTEVAVTTGTPVGIERSSRGDEWALVATTGTLTTNRVYLWSKGEGLHSDVSYTAGAGATDLMWGDPSLFGGSQAVVLGHGVNGADSKTYDLTSGLVGGNNWPAGFGNPGGAGWRSCGGTYGMFTGWSTNLVYVYDSSWTSTVLPGVSTAAAPQSVGWRNDGSRALIVGRVIPPLPIRATVIDHQPGVVAAYDPNAYVDASIPDFDLAPWLGNTSQYLLDVDWRPGSVCDEGLIVGSDPGLLIRFYDSDDGDCP